MIPLCNRWNRLSAVMLVMGALLLNISNSFAWSECRTHYNDALTLLNSTTQKASANQHPNPDGFANDFKAIIDKMKTEKCMPELMSLVQHIKAEQQKLPAATEAKKSPAPIVD